MEKYELDNIDQLLLRQLTEFPESTASELAAIVSYSVTGTKKRLQKPALRKALAELQQSTDDVLKGLAQLALRRLRTLMMSDDQKVSLDACKSVMALHDSRQSTRVISTARVIYEVQFGQDGRLFRQVSGLDDAETYPTTVDIAKC